MGVDQLTADGTTSEGLEPIQTKSLSGTTIEHTGVFATDDGYRDYQLRFRNLKANGDVLIRFSDDGGATYYSGTEYFWSRRRSGTGGGGSNDGPAGGQSEIKPVFNTDANNDPKNGVDGVYEIFNPTDASAPTRITGTNVHFAEAMSTRHWNFSGGGMLKTQTAVDSVKILGGTEIVAGEVGVYGLK